MGGRARPFTSDPAHFASEFIAELNTDRARASIRSLIGSVPQVALVRDADGERTVQIADLKIGDVVLVRPGEKIPVDGLRRDRLSPTESGITGRDLREPFLHHRRDERHG